MVKPLTVDVIIVGAGLAGSSLACALAQGDSHLRIALVESQVAAPLAMRLEDKVAGYDPRVSALTLASQQFLEDLGAWSTLSEQRLGAYREMHVWDAEGTGFVDFSAADIQQPQLGHIVENRLLLANLMAELKSLLNVHCLMPAKLAAMNYEEGVRSVILEDGRELQAPLLIAADGANSFIRRTAGLETREWDYQHHAIVATVKTAKHHQYTAWQRFLSSGPLAFLPLGNAIEDAESCGYFCSIVWSTSPEQAEQLMALDDGAFSKALGEAFEYRLGDIQAVSRRFSFPLRQRHAKDYIQPGLALIGDAAHTIHPLAGQGINLGFSDVQVLAEEILRARKRAVALSDESILQRYQRRRKGDNLAMMAAMEGFKRLFAEPRLPIRWLRNSGMRVFNQAAPLKHAVIRRAMGLN